MSAWRHHSRTSLAHALRRAWSHWPQAGTAWCGAWLSQDAIGTLLFGVGTDGLLAGMREGVVEAFGGLVVVFWIVGTGSGLLVFLSGRWGAVAHSAPMPALPLRPTHRALAEVLPWLGLVLALAQVPWGIGACFAPHTLTRSGPQVVASVLVTAWMMGAWMATEQWAGLVHRPRHLSRTIIAFPLVFLTGLLLPLPTVAVLVLWPAALLCAVAVASRRQGPHDGTARFLQGQPVAPHRRARPAQAWHDVLGLQAWVPPGSSRLALGLTALALAALLFWLGWAVGWDDLGATVILWAVPWLVLWARPLGFASVDLGELQRRAALLPIRPGHLITAATLQRLLFGVVMLATAAVTGPLLAHGATLASLQWTLAGLAMVVGVVPAAMGLGAARGPRAGLALALVAIAGGVWLVLGSGLLPGPGIWTAQVLGVLALLVLGPLLAVLPWILRPRPAAL